MTSKYVDGEPSEQSALFQDEQVHSSRGYGTAASAPTNAVESTEGIRNAERETPVTGIAFDWKILWRKNLVLLLGSFLVNADSSMTYSIFRKMGSEFNQLSAASYIVTGWITGTIVSQPIFGKLSDIYGRKAMLVFVCACACTGQTIAGVGFSFYWVVLGRVIAGVANAGMSVLVSTIIVDIVPFQQIAFWRSIIYASNQVGRSSGLPLGGIITDAMNWRWALLFQVPLYLIIGVYIWWKMELPGPEISEDAEHSGENPRLAKFRRIDFPGVISLGLSNISLMIFLDQAPQKASIVKSIFTIIPLGSWFAFLVAFICIEAYVAPEPVLPLGLLANRNVLSAYAIQFFTGAVQTGLYSCLPLYFRVTKGASSFYVSMRLLFLTVGSMSGTLFSGAFITRTGRYRRLTQTIQAIYIINCTLIFVRWRGDTSWVETVYATVAGICFSIPLSATFIALTDGLPHSQTAVATSGFYLCLNLGANVGIGISNLIVQTVLRQQLTMKLAGTPGWRRLVRAITSNIDNLERLSSKVRQIAVDAYTVSLIDVWLFFVVTACISFIASLLLRKEHSKASRPVD